MERVGFPFVYPEFLLKDDYELYREVIEEQNRQGYRILVFGKYPAVPDGGELTAPHETKSRREAGREPCFAAVLFFRITAAGSRAPRRCGGSPRPRG